MTPGHAPGSDNKHDLSGPSEPLVKLSQSLLKTVQLLDVEWLLSTLFDASLLSPSSRRQRRLFFVPFRASPRIAPPACSRGNYVRIFSIPVLDSDTMTGPCWPHRA